MIDTYIVYGEQRDGAGVMDNDTDPEGDPLTAVLVTPASNGIVVLDADGSFTYTPDPGWFGVDTFTYKVNDGTSDSNVATATLNVLQVIDVSGIVFEDVAGDGVKDGGDPGVSGVTVDLYGDTNLDGLPNAGDTWIATDTTDGTGAYALTLPAATPHWVVVDSRDVKRSGVGVDPEQTYGPINGFCTNGDSPETYTVRGTAGPCFGGYRGDIVDDFNIAGNAEHLALYGTGGSNVDFGFSFNVVTRTADTVDQGSIANFINNANVLAGANAMRFVPAVPPNDGPALWWEVIVTSNLPAVSDAATVINGTAYQISDGLAVRDQNPGYLGANAGGGMTVGVDGVALPQIEKPELEIQGSGTSTGVQLQANDAEVHRVAVYGFSGHNIKVGPSGGPDYTGVIIENNVIRDRSRLVQCQLAFWIDARCVCVSTPMELRSIEKLFSSGVWFGRVTGVGFIFAGTVMLVL